VTPEQKIDQIYEWLEELMPFARRAMKMMDNNPLLKVREKVLNGGFRTGKRGD
jgi:hypothetical protein